MSNKCKNNTCNAYNNINRQISKEIYIFKIHNQLMISIYLLNTKYRNNISLFDFILKYYY